MVVLWSIAVLLELYGYGIAILYNIYKHWSDQNKIFHRWNEIFYGFLYLIFGSLSPFLFVEDGLPYEFESHLYMIMFFVFIVMDAFWWFGNLIPNIIKCRKDPEEKERRSYDKFVKYITEHHVDTIKRDLSRKALHFLMWGIVVFLFVYASLDSVKINASWHNYWAFCKFWYTLIAYTFTNMFTLADLIRTNKNYALPSWARNWFKTSISPREAYTFISSIPYVLTLSLFQFAPVQILFIATSVSTFADAGASLFGKAFGKHNFPEKLDRKKTFEGLIAGCLLAFLSSALILVSFPFKGQNISLILLMGSLSAVIFACIDLFSKRVADNITNVLFPGLVSWLLVFLTLGSSIASSIAIGT